MKCLFLTFVDWAQMFIFLYQSIYLCNTSQYKSSGLRGWLMGLTALAALAEDMDSYSCQGDMVADSHL